MAVGYSRRTSRRSVAEHVRRRGQQLLQVGLDAVLLQAGVGAEVPGLVAQDLRQRDA